MQKRLQFYGCLPWLAAVAGLILLGLLPDFGRLEYVIFMAAFAALAMGWDKQVAQGDGVRVPERVLYTWALLGGALGVVAGMYLFHHKVRHPIFRYFLPALGALQLYLVQFGFPW